MTKAPERLMTVRTGAEPPRFRTLLLTAMLGLLIAIVVASLAAVAIVVNRSARKSVDEELHRAHDVFADLQRYRDTLFRSESRVVAEEPRIKAVVASDETSPETVQGVLAEVKKALRCDVLLIADPNANVIADANDVEASGQTLSHDPLIAQALRDGEASGVWVDSKSAVQLQARRLVFGSTVVGVMMIGYRVDDRVAETVFRQTASPVAIELDGAVIAASPFEDEHRPDRATLAAALKTVGTTPAEIDVDGVRYLALAAPFPGYQGKANVRYVVLRSLDAALAPGRQLVTVLMVILLIAGLFAFASALGLARRLSRPIDALVAFTRRVAAGELKARAQPSGAREVVALGEAMNAMVEEIDASRAQLAVKERLEREMEIASTLQTSILPRKLEVAGLEISARMRPASEVGGDYYDVLPFEGGAWLGIGDVAGHGLGAGVIMLMIQTVVAALVKASPTRAPADLVSMLNEVLFANVRGRMERNEHTTLTLLRYTAAGELTWAGAHEEILVARANGTLEKLANPGTWVGAMKDVRRFTVDTSTQLFPGDVLLLYTDGATEAKKADGAQYGLERLGEALMRERQQSAEVIRDRLMAEVEAWDERREDDLTLMVVRYKGAAP